jgi:hypothetical protein
MRFRRLVPGALALLLGAAAPASRGGIALRLDPPAGPGAMAPSLTLAGADVLLTWLEPVDAKGGKGHRLRFSRLSGDRWATPVTIASGSRFFANWADFPGSIQATDGSIVVHWLEETGANDYAYGVKLARSTDGGATWAPAGPLHPEDNLNEHGFVAWVPEGKGGVRGFWLDGREMKGKGEAEGAMTLRTAIVRNGKAAGEERIDGQVCSCCQTDAAVAAGGPVVTYRDRSGEEVRDVYVIRRTPWGWSRPVRVHADNWKIPGCPVNGPAIAASGRRVAVAWFTAAPPNPRVYVAFSEDGGATFGPAALVDSGQPFGRVDLALDGNGDALVGWLAANGKDAGVRLRRVTAGGKPGRPLTLAVTSGARSSGFPRLVRDGGRLVVAWVDDGTPSKVRAAAVPVSAIR